MMNGRETTASYSYSWVITKDMLKDYYKAYTSGAGWPNYKIMANIYINRSKIFVAYLDQFNNDVTDKVELSVYYR